MVKLYLLIVLLVSIIVYQNYQYVLDYYANFINRVNDTYTATTEKKLDANEILKEIKKGKDSEYSMNTIYKNLISFKETPSYDSDLIPRDYKYFFNDFLKIEEEKTDSTGVLLDDNIIFSSYNTSSYSAKLNFSKGQSYIEHKKAIDKIQSKKIVITGTYSTPEELPTGLAIDNGVVISPFIFNWDGLLVVYGNGLMEVQHRNFLNIGGRKFNLSKGFTELQKLIDFCRIRNISIIQSHLILNNGENLSNPNNSKKFRRRVIFTNASGVVSVFDSFEDQLTLFETAELIKSKYGGFNAMNLDMGTYNLGLIKNKKTVRDISNIGRSTKLTNVIEIISN